jgi:hypothetical protein
MTATPNDLASGDGTIFCPVCEQRVGLIRSTPNGVWVIASHKRSTAGTLRPCNASLRSYYGALFNASTRRYFTMDCHYLRHYACTGTTSRGNRCGCPCHVVRSGTPHPNDAGCGCYTCAMQRIDANNRAEQERVRNAIGDLHRQYLPSNQAAESQAEGARNPENGDEEQSVPQIEHDLTVRVQAEIKTFGHDSVATESVVRTFAKHMYRAFGQVVEITVRHPTAGWCRVVFDPFAEDGEHPGHKQAMAFTPINVPGDPFRERVRVGLEKQTVRGMNDDLWKILRELHEES